MTFYQSCLGGDLTLIKLSDTPMKDQFPAEKHNRTIYAQLKNNQISLSATDWMASPTLEPVKGNTFAVYITGKSEVELKTVFDKLSVDCDRDTRTFIELKNAPMGLYGQFTDKYGVSWIFKGEN